MQELNSEARVAEIKNCFQNGSIHASNKQYEVSFEAYRAGNELVRAGIIYDVTSAEQMVTEAITLFSKDNLEKMKLSQRNYSEKPVFIVGMPRSGSTLVEQILSMHSQVTGLGEINTLADIHIAGIDSIQDWADKYLATIECKSKRIISKQLYNYLAIGLIHVMFPNAKIIHMKRDAVETCFSCYKLNFIEKAEWSYTQHELARYYKSYERMMKHWAEVCPDAFITVNYEDVVNHIEQTTYTMLTYLGLEFETYCLEPHKNLREVHTASKNQVKQPLYTNSLTTSLDYIPYLTELIIGLNNSSGSCSGIDPSK